MPKAPSKSLSKTKPAAALEIMPEVNDAQLGAELTGYFHEAEDGFRRVLRFGAAFMRVEQIVMSTRGHNSPKRGPGAYGFANWLEDHAPEISRASAIRYRDITEALCLKFKIKNPELVFDADIKALPEADQAKRAKALAFVEDKSMRQIQLELDLTTPKTSERPQAVQRGQASAEKTEDEKAADFITSARRRALEILIDLNEIEDRWQLLPDEQLKITQADCEKLATEIKAWRATAPARRATFDARRHLDGTAEKELADRRSEGSALAALAPSA